VAGVLEAKENVSMYRVKAVWNRGLQFVGMSESGHAIVMDTKSELGGFESAATPVETTLLGLCGCTGMDVVSILWKKRVEFDDFEVAVEAEKSPQPPNYFTRIELVFRIWGANVPEAAVQRSIELSSDKYCTVTGTLRGKAEVTYRYEINPER
jgi:putative redox protein